MKLLDWGEEGQRTEAEIASLRAAFTQEVAVWHKLDHPNVTKVNFNFFNINLCYCNFNLLSLWFQCCVCWYNCVYLGGGIHLNIELSSIWSLMNLCYQLRVSFSIECKSVLLHKYAFAYYVYAYLLSVLDFLCCCILVYNELIMCLFV